MSPQHSSRAQLLEGTLRCLETLPLEQITARAIARESSANLASIGYHFGSKDALVTQAAITGLDRWLADVASRVAGVSDADPRVRMRLAAEAVTASRELHAGLARVYVATLAKAQYDAAVRAALAEGFRAARPEVARLLGLGDDTVGDDAAGLALAMFHGLLIQVLLDPQLGVDGAALDDASVRLRHVF